MAARTSSPKKLYSQGLSEQSSPYVRVLSVGYSKVGKTHFALTFPNPVIANADAGLATDIPINCKVDPCVFSFVRVHEGIQDNELCSWQDLLQLARELRYRKGNLWDEVKSYGYTPETFVIDSGTAFSNLFAHEIISEDSHRKKDGSKMETLEIQDYNLILFRFCQIMDAVKVLPMHVVMTAELADKQDELNRRYQQPAMTGQALGNHLPHYFDEIYLHYNRVEKDEKVHFYLTPMPQRGFEHIGSRKGIPMEEIENPSFSMLEKYYVKRKK